MKNKQIRKKRNFVELNLKGEIVNNNEFKEKNTEKSVKNATDIETPLKILTKEFPQADIEIIETLLDNNLRDIIKTRQSLKELYPINIEKNAKIDILDNRYCGEFNTTKTEKVVIDPKNEFININAYDSEDFEVIEDINKYVKFHTFSDEDDDKYTYSKKDQIKNKNDKEINRLELTYTHSNKKQNSVKNINIYAPYLSTMLDENSLEFYIKLFKEIFPTKEETEIIQQICDADYNIEEVLMKFIDEDLTSTPNDPLSIVLENEGKFDLNLNTKSILGEDIDLEFFSLAQKEVYKNIKIDQAKNKIITEKYDENFPSLNKLSSSNKSGDGSDKYNDNNFDEEIQFEEEFLGKELSQIKTPKIKEDLTKLYRKFPMRNEYELKLMYYQFGGNYLKTMCFIKNCGEYEKPSSKLERIFSQNKCNSNNYSNNSKSISQINDNNTQKFVFSQKKENFDLNTEKNYTEDNKDVKNDNEFKLVGKKERKIYNNQLSKKNPFKINSNNVEKDFSEESIKNNSISLSLIHEKRQNMFKLINLAMRQGRRDTAKSLLTNAKALKQEVLEMIKKREIIIDGNLPVHNYDVIDLHGFTVEESKIIIRRRINYIISLYDNGEISSSKTILNIITGVGNHSKNGGVLFPRLTEWLDSDYGYLKKKLIFENGIIRIKCKK